MLVSLRKRHSKTLVNPIRGCSWAPGEHLPWIRHCCLPLSPFSAVPAISRESNADMQSLISCQIHLWRRRRNCIQSRKWLLSHCTRPAAFYITSRRLWLQPSATGYCQQLEYSTSYYTAAYIHTAAALPDDVVSASSIDSFLHHLKTSVRTICLLFITLVNLAV